MLRCYFFRRPVNAGRSIIACLLGSLLSGLPFGSSAVRADPTIPLQSRRPSVVRQRLQAETHGAAAATNPSKKPDENSTEEAWFGIYFANKKVGWNRSNTTPIVYASQPALKEHDESVTRIQLLGTTVEQDEKSDTITDLKHHPLQQSFTVKSNGSAIHVEATFNYSTHKIFCTIGEGPSASHKTLDIPAGANLTADTTSIAEGQELAIGKGFQFYYLEPLSVELRSARASVTEKTRIRNDEGQESPVFVMTSDIMGGKMTAWTDAAGRFIKSEVNLGVASMTIVQESKAHALDDQYVSPVAAGTGLASPTSDFADATAIVPDHLLPNPRSLRSLKVRISGVPESALMPSDSRQGAVIVSRQEDRKELTVDYSIASERITAQESSKWPVAETDMQPYLASAPYLETGDPQIEQIAHKLKGKETNLYRLACLIRNWVHKEMTPDASIGVPRSARDIFLRRRGVCRDYATLYTAVARAAGIPTRLCAGIVYSEGKFFYHAWAESFVGRWVAFDPTLYSPADAEYVDATHIKFAQGDVTRMFNVVSIVGRLHIQVQAADKVTVVN